MRDFKRLPAERETRDGQPKVAPPLLHLFEATAVLLFLVQSVRVLFSVLFGLIYDTIFAGTVAFGALGLILLFVILAFLAPLLGPRRNRSSLLSFVTVLIVALARVPLTVNWPAMRLGSGILIVGAATLYILALLYRRPYLFPTGLLLAFAIDQVLRAAGDTFDVGLRSWWVPVQAALSLAVCVVACLKFSRSLGEPPVKGGLDVAGGLAVGALLFLETSLLGFPNALARWSGLDYAVAAPLLMAITLLPLMPGVRQAWTFLLGNSRGWASARWLGGWALLCLSLTGLVVGRYASAPVAIVGLLITQFLVLLAFPNVVGSGQSERTRLGLALGMLLFLVLNFALAFTFTYPYTIPIFRGMGLYVFLAAAAIACLPALYPQPVRLEAWSLKTRAWRWLPAALTVLLTVALAWTPALEVREAGPLRVGTYNIHYGYNTPWQFNLEGIARTIEESGADVVMLQEVDACRITSYGVDDALWLARRLGMREIYGPALEELSGVALLTHFPVVEADTQLLTSQLEQTSIVYARVQVSDRSLQAYGIWLGLEPEERARQLDDALTYIGDASPAVLGGDFNAIPDSPTYARVLAAGFEDPFVVGDFAPAPTSPAIEPAERIDFIWARGLEVWDAQVLDSLASDHRMVVVGLALP
jgi:endonuclease/exonuclease/phosphatase family metal-dependent hydrolase